MYTGHVRNSLPDDASVATRCLRGPGNSKFSFMKDELKSLVN